MRTSANARRFDDEKRKREKEKERREENTTNPNVYLVQKFSVRSHNEYFNDFLWMLAPLSQLQSRHP